MTSSLGVASTSVRSGTARRPHPRHGNPAPTPSALATGRSAPSPIPPAIPGWSRRRQGGGVDASGAGVGSRGDVASALRRAEAAYAEHQKRTGRSHLFRRPGQDENRPAWYAAYMAAEQAGTDLPA